MWRSGSGSKSFRRSDSFEYALDMLLMKTETYVLAYDKRARPQVEHVGYAVASTHALKVGARRKATFPEIASKLVRPAMGVSEELCQEM